MEFEKIQVSSKKVVDGPVKIWLVIYTLILVLLDFHVQIFALIIFSILCFHATRSFYLLFVSVPLLFLLPATLVILLTLEGEPILKINFLKITDKSLETAANTILRSFSAITVMSYLVLTTTLPEFLSALKLPNFLREFMATTYRAIQILFNEAEKLKKASDSRLGFLGLKRQFRSVKIVSIMIFLKSMEKVEKFEMAKEARCYSGKFPSFSNENKGLPLAILIALLLTLGVFI
ncbi:MAG: CbiQ family ECF transporter T component [Archaeoglobaceae archaeon]|nr:CbiQ family ECF transporter T component [Archaeoglobaceae archaeon]MCX8152494.1 CbiQ family ECF transporter T component [Archaeoglobaceae archaeon]MDW8013691.1 CbiQ family ECF transporter T component [Archaeoglobaceae archaeon]